jgi:predicted metalloprotease
MGVNLLRTLRRGAESPEVGVAAVCSHEFGHILQFKYGLIERVNAGQTTVKRSELQADYFAGYFAGLRKKERPTYPAAVVAVTLFSVGDTAFTEPGHHGTPAERGAAVVKGFEASFRSNKSLSEAIQESTSYVMTI